MARNELKNRRSGEGNHLAGDTTLLADPPDAVGGLTADARNWLTRNDAFFGRFEYAIRSALHEFVAKDLGDADAEIVTEIVDDARDELGAAAKVILRRAFSRILGYLHNDDGDKVKLGIGTKGTT
jgi:hypothetical protein